MHNRNTHLNALYSNIIVLMSREYIMNGYNYTTADFQYFLCVLPVSVWKLHEMEKLEKCQIIVK